MIASMYQGINVSMIASGYDWINVNEEKAHTVFWKEDTAASNLPNIECLWV